MVDVWDAITNDRPYHKARTPAETLELIRGESGHHFDPRIVAAFEEMVVELGLLNV